MAFCTKCGHQLGVHEQVCSRCGQAVAARKVKTMTPPQHEYTPYSWANTDPSAGPIMQPQPQPLMQPQYVSPLARGGYRCPRCGSHNAPVIDSRISVAGWIIFATMIIFCLPLFWIGLLMKEEYTVCPVCRCQLS